LATSEESSDWRAKRLADLPGARLGVGAFAPGGGDLALQLGELLADQAGIVAADEEIGLGAVILDLGSASDTLLEAFKLPSHWPADRA
jgi:hypothetical protein